MSKQEEENTCDVTQKPCSILDTLDDLVQGELELIEDFDVQLAKRKADSDIFDVRSDSEVDFRNTIENKKRHKEQSKKCIRMEIMR